MATEGSLKPGGGASLRPGGGGSGAGAGAVEPAGPQHNLHQTWTLWYNNTSKGGGGDEAWLGKLREVYTFSTVETFWCLYNNILPASRLSMQSDFSLFVKGIQPTWEDEANAKGGRWIITVPKGERHRSLDAWWLYSMLTCIGETLDDTGSEIAGVVVSIRKREDRVAVWTRNAANEELQMKIGHEIRRLVDVPINIPVKYQAHNDAIAAGGRAGKKCAYEA